MDNDKRQARRVAASILASIGLFGLNSMYGQIYRNGYIERVRGILASPKPLLPGPSQIPLLTRYTSLPLMDSLLSLGAVLWANVTDGSSPALSLYAFQFGGQLVPIYLIMLIEGRSSITSRQPLF